MTTISLISKVETFSLTGMPRQTSGDLQAFLKELAEPPSTWLAKRYVRVNTEYSIHKELFDDEVILLSRVSLTVCELSPIERTVRRMVCDRVRTYRCYAPGVNFLHSTHLWPLSKQLNATLPKNQHITLNLNGGRKEVVLFIEKIFNRHLHAASQSRDSRSLQIA